MAVVSCCELFKPHVCLLHSDSMTSEESADGARQYMATKSMLLNIGDAVERLMSSMKKVSELVGYTDRVHTLFKVFDDCANENYVRANNVNDTKQSAKPKRLRDVSQSSSKSRSYRPARGEMIDRSYGAQGIHKLHMLIMCHNNVFQLYSRRNCYNTNK
jgi:hypothetical protein